jgi:virginiamycin B lyase
MMSNREHSLPLGEQDNNAEIPQSRTIAAFHTQQRTTHWSARRRRDAWFLLLVLLLGVVAIAALSSGGAGSSYRANVTQPGTTPGAVTKTSSPPTRAITATGVFREYPFLQSDSQVMRLAIDHEGRVWFGEMGRNSLAVFDPQTQGFQQMTPPHGRYGMMGIQAAPDDTIWFAEQYANYIGHYFPATGHFQLYPLPRLTIPDPGHPGKTLTIPSAPNDLVLDAHGTPWFTEFNADALGRLDPRTGRMQHYPLAGKKSVQTIDPYGVTVDPQGMVWFTEMSINHVGRLDPATGRIRYFPVPGPKVSLMEIASDAHGTIWVTSFSSGLLLRLDPRTGRTTSYYASLTGKDPGGLYGLVVAPSGDVWVTILAENVIAHLDVAAHRFIYYRIPTPGSEPLTMAMGPDHTLWFIEIDKIGMLRP